VARYRHKLLHICAVRDNPHANEWQDRVGTHDVDNFASELRRALPVFGRRCSSCEGETLAGTFNRGTVWGSVQSVIAVDIPALQ